MAVVAEELVSELIVRDGKLRAGLNSAKQVYSQGVGQMRGETRKMEQEFTRSSGAISSSFKAMAASLAAGVSTAAVGQMIDGYTRLQNQLRVTGLEGQDLADVQERLREIGNQYGTDLESLATVYGRVSIAAKELGASSQEILRVNEAVAAALKVSGTSSAQASGALLQLSQAMGAGVVRAEEFNSILEGAFPLAQAAARGIDGMEGSVAKLRSAIIEGNVTSQQFFQGILAGAPQLIDQAAKANMTLAQSFTVLKNELTLYVGSAASSSGVTGAMAEGISKLAENLERIIPALSIIAAMIGVRYVGAAAAATAATIAKGVATARETAYTQAYNAALIKNAGLLNAQAMAAQRAAAATTGLGVAARGAGAALLGAFGGPVGVALTALGAALYLASQRTTDLQKASGDLQKSHAQVSTASDNAKAAIDRLATSYGEARTEALRLLEVQRQLAAAAVATASQDLFTAEQNAARARQNTGRYSGAIDESTAVDLRVAQETLNLARKTLGDLERATTAGAAATGGGGSIASTATKKTGRGRSGPSAEEIEQRYAAELERGLVDIEMINAQRRQNADEMAAAEVTRIRVEQQIAARSIQADADYSQAQKNVLLAINDQRAAAMISAVNADEAARISDDRIEMMQLDLDIQRDTLQRAYDLADTQGERRTIAMAMLDLEEQVRTAKLDELLAQENLTDAVRERAERERAAIAGEFAQRRESATRDTESPMEKYRRESARTADQIIEDMQRAQVQGFEALGDGITNAIMGTESLGDVFKKVANQIIADLIRIAVQQTVVNSLMGGLFGGGGGGGAIGIGGRAGGGRVNAGQLYRINESGQEYFRPASDGTVISAAQMNTAAARSGGGQPVVVQISVSEGALFEPTVQRISGDVSIQAIQASAPSIIRAAGTEVQRRAARPRA